MKKYMVFSVLLITVNWAAAQKFVLVNCISGDCQNGTGIAEFTAPAQGDLSGSVIYKGAFKNGKMSGEGVVYNDHHYYSGNFDNNYYIGYGTMFYSKTKGNAILPDSLTSLDFCKWDEDGCNIRMTLQTDNYKVAQSYGANKKHKKFWEYTAIKDEGLKQMIKAFKATGVRGYIAEYEESIIAEKNINAPRGQPATFIAWDCLADRQYFVTASATNNGKYMLMPLSGSVTYQVSAEDGLVVFEGPVDRYWKPLKDGKYTFTVKFDQGQIYGNGYVDGVTLSCSLRSRRLL